MKYSEIKTKLLEQRKIALLEKDEVKKSIISILSSRLNLLNKELEMKGQQITETDVIGILSNELKQTKEALIEAEKFNREDAIKTATEQIKFIESFLPKQLSEEEIKEFIINTINDLGITEPTNKDMGRIMKVVSPSLKGKADGKLVSNLVKSLLN